VESSSLQFTLQRSVLPTAFYSHISYQVLGNVVTGYVHVTEIQARFESMTNPSLKPAVDSHNNLWIIRCLKLQPWKPSNNFNFRFSRTIVHAKTTSS